MVLGSDEAVQKLVFRGGTDSTKDAQTTQARIDATSICLSFLNLELEPSSPSSQLTSAVNLIAASLVTNDKDKADQFSKEGHDLLEKYKGDNPDEVRWGINQILRRG